MVQRSRTFFLILISFYIPFYYGCSSTDSGEYSGVRSNDSDGTVSEGSVREYESDAEKWDSSQEVDAMREEAFEDISHDDFAESVDDDISYDRVVDGSSDEDEMLDENKVHPLYERLKNTVFNVGAHQGGIYDGNTPTARINTIRQFKQAKNQGAHIIETDLRITRDGVIVLFHDETLDTRTNCKGAVEDKDYAEVKECTRSLTSEKIDSYEDVLKWSGGDIIINGEFKSENAIEAALDLVKKYDAYGFVYFQTKNDEERYHRARSYDKDVALLFKGDSPEKLSWALELDDRNLVVIEIDEETRMPQYIDAIHNAGKVVSDNSFRYDSLKEYQKAHCDWVFGNNIDIAITNRPDKCREQREEAVSN